MRVTQLHRSNRLILPGETIQIILNREDIEFMISEIEGNSLYKDGFWSDMLKELYRELDRWEELI